MQSTTTNTKKLSAEEKLKKDLANEQQQQRLYLQNDGHSRAGAQAALAFEEKDESARQALSAEPEETIINKGDPTGPFWGGKEDQNTTITQIDRIMTDFEVEDFKIKAQGRTSHRIQGGSSKYNNAASLFRGKGRSFEEYLATEKGQDIYFLLHHLNKLRKITCTDEGKTLDIPQRDAFGGFFAEISEIWFPPNAPDYDAGKVAMKRMFQNSDYIPDGLQSEPIFQALKELVSYEQMQMYDAYVFCLITLFIWFEDESSLETKEKIDTFINQNWFFKSRGDDHSREHGLSIQHVRDKCLLYRSFFPQHMEKNPVKAIEKSLQKQLDIIKARPEDERRYNIFPERREITRITVFYDTKTFHDDWTIDQLLLAFHRELTNRNVRFDIPRDTLFAMVQEKFHETLPGVDKSIEMDFMLNTRIAYDTRTLAFIGIPSLTLQEREFIDEEYTLSLRFDSTATGSIKEPKLVYILTPVDQDKKDNSLSGAVQPLLDFDHKLAYEFLTAYFTDEYGNVNEEEAMGIYRELLSNLEARIKEVVPDTPQATPTSPTISPKPQARKLKRKAAAFLKQETDSDDDEDTESNDSYEEEEMEDTPSFPAIAAAAIAEAAASEASFDTDSITIDAGAYGRMTFKNFFKNSASAHLEIIVSEHLRVQEEMALYEKEQQEDEEQDEEEEQTSYDKNSVEYQELKAKLASIMGTKDRLQELGINADERDMHDDTGRFRLVLKGKTVPVFVARPPEIMRYGLNVLDTTPLYPSYDNPRFHENGSSVNGFYPHQIQVIETIGRSFADNTESILILEASVGSGKTTVTIALAQYMHLIGEERDLGKRPLLIYAATSKGLLQDIFRRCSNLKLSVVGCSHVSSNFKGGKRSAKVVFRRPGRPAKGQSDSSFYYKADEKPLASCDILVCHMRTLIYVLQLLEKKDEFRRPLHTGRPYAIIIDEIDHKYINSADEHSLGAVLAFKPAAPRHKNIAIFSASVKGDGPIKFLTSNYNNVKVVNNSTTLVPTELRQMNGKPLDLYLGYNDQRIIKKVNDDAFFKRFVSYGCIQQIQKASSIEVLPNTDKYAHRDKIAALEDRVKRFFKRIAANNVMDHSMIYGMFPYHRQVRFFMKEAFTLYTYDNDISDKGWDIFDKYITFLDRAPDKIAHQCRELLVWCEAEKEMLEKQPKRVENIDGQSTTLPSKNAQGLRLWEITQFQEYVKYISTNCETDIKKFIEDYNADIPTDATGQKHGEIHETAFTKLSRDVAAVRRNDDILQRIKKEILCIRSATVFARSEFDSTVAEALKMIRDTRRAIPQEHQVKKLRVASYLEYVQKQKRIEGMGEFLRNATIADDKLLCWDDTPGGSEMGQKGRAIRGRLMQEAFETVSILYNVPELLDDIQHLFTPEAMNLLDRIRDEYNKIRNTEYYTMIGTDTYTGTEQSKRPQSPKDLMEKIYGSVAYHIFQLLKSFHEQYPPNYVPTQYAGNKKPSDREGLAKQLHDEYTEAIKSKIPMRFEIFHERRDVKTFEEWLHYIIETSPARKGQIGDIGQGALTREKRDTRKRGAVTSSLPEDAARLAGVEAEHKEGGGTGKTIRKGKHATILQAWDNYQKMKFQTGDSVDQMAQMIHDVEHQCELILKRVGFNHTQPIVLTRQDITEIVNGGRLAAVYELIGVYSAAEPMECPRERNNRLFVDVACARGVDIPLESVIVTKAFSDAYSADDILQLSGRCGRPSQSIISVVYIAEDSYRKSITQDQTRGLVNTLLRYHYYRQELEATSIDAPAAHDEKNSRVASLVVEAYNKQIF